MCQENIGNDPKGTAELKASSARIEAETDKIDSAAADGLLGTPNAVAYVVAELERHIHNTEQWFGMALVPDGEDHVADDMGVADNPFTLTAGNNTFGDWVQILGADDTPIISGAVKFDAHRVLVEGTDATNPFVIQVVGGEFADIPTRIAAKLYTTTPYISPTNNNDAGIEDVLVRRTPAGEKVWARCRCIGLSGSTLSFFFGIHEYEG